MSIRRISDKQKRYSHVEAKSNNVMIAQSSYKIEDEFLCICKETLVPRRHSTTTMLLTSQT
jgi:hypothetical protein